MINVPNFELMDEKRRWEELSKFLSDVKQEINRKENIQTMSNEVKYWVNDNVTPIPKPYQEMNGTNGTFDIKRFPVIPIQKV